MTEEANTSIDVKTRVEILRFISETHRKARADRRGPHYQAFFTTLTFFAIVAAAKFSDKVVIPKEHFSVFSTAVWILLIIVAVLSSIHILGLDAANKVNRQIAQNAETELMKLSGLPSPTNAGRWIAQVHAWEVAMVIIFAVAAGISLTVL